MKFLRDLYSDVLDLFSFPDLEVYGFEEKKNLFTKQSIEFRISDDDLRGILSPSYIGYIKKALIKKLEELGAKYIKDENNNVNVVIKLHSFGGCSTKVAEFSWDIRCSMPAIVKYGIVLRGLMSRSYFFQCGNKKIVEQFCEVAEKIVESRMNKKVKKSKVVV